jgi:two-component system, response regulator RegA
MNLPESLLFIDDDERFRERMARALSARGVSVHTASCPQQARSVIAEHTLAGIITDLRLPGVAGLEWVKELLDARPGTPLVVLTGYGSIASAVEAIRLGAKDYLVKPCNADQLLGALGEAAGEAPEDVLAGRTPTLERLEHEHIERVLAECNHNVSKSARVLGIHRRTLQYKLSKFPNSG